MTNDDTEVSQEEFNKIYKKLHKVDKTLHGNPGICDRIEKNERNIDSIKTDVRWIKDTVKSINSRLWGLVIAMIPVLITVIVTLVLYFGI